MVRVLLRHGATFDSAEALKRAARLDSRISIRR
jgi:hypothetical protein